MSMGNCHSFSVVGDHPQKIYSNGVEKLYVITTHPTKSVGSSLRTAESVNMETIKCLFCASHTFFLINADFL